MIESNLILGFALGGTVGIVIGMLTLGLIFRDAILTAFNMAGVKSDFSKRLITVSNEELSEEEELRTAQEATAKSLELFATQEWIAENVLKRVPYSDGEENDRKVYDL